MNLYKNNERKEIKTVSGPVFPLRCVPKSANDILMKRVQDWNQEHSLEYQLNLPL